MANPIAENVNTADQLFRILGKLVGESGPTSTISKSGGSYSDMYSGTKQTEQTQMSQEAVNSMLRSMMEASGGLASISAGQKAPGLYNTTSRSLLVNDLLSRSAGKVAELSAPKVTMAEPKTVSRQAQPEVQTTQSAQKGLMSPTSALIGAGALIAGSSAARKKIGEGWDWLTGADEKDGYVMGDWATSELARGSTMSDAAMNQYIGGGWTGAGVDEVAAMPMDQMSAMNPMDGAGSWTDLPILSTLGFINQAENGNALGGVLGTAGSAIGGPIGGFIGNTLGSIITAPNISGDVAPYFDEGSTLDSVGDFFDSIFNWFD